MNVNLVARAALNLSALVIVGSLLMLVGTRSGTPERTITLFALVGGTAVLAATVAAVRLRRPGRPSQEDQ